MNNAKTALRNQIRKLLNSSVLTSDEKKRQSIIVYEKLLKNEKFVTSKRIAVYLSDNSREVDTSYVLKHCFDCDKKCFIPKCDANTRDMNFYRLYSMDDYHRLPETAWHIKQPTDDDVWHRESCMTAEDTGLDVIIVPGVAFTPDGHRLGHGKGYYDTFLHNYSQYCRHNGLVSPYLIGLAFDQQIVTTLPVDEHDFKIDLVVTSQLLTTKSL